MNLALRQTRSRLALRASALVAAAATLPYLTLNVAWVSGSTVGMTDPARLATSVYRVGNALTILMDAAVIGLAGALAFPARVPLPRWTVPVGGWLATGFLIPLPLIAVTVLASEAAETEADSGLRSWVWAMVYVGFLVQGVALLTAFALRVWPWRQALARRRASLLVCAWAVSAVLSASSLVLITEQTLRGTVSAVALCGGLAAVGSWHRRPIAMWIGSSGAGCWAVWLLVVRQVANGPLPALITAGCPLAALSAGLTLMGDAKLVSQQTKALS